MNTLFTPMRTAAVAMVLLLLAGRCVQLSLRRSPASVASARRAMTGEHGASTDVRARVVDGPLTDWTARRFGDDLALLGRTAPTVATDIVTAAGMVGAISLLAVAGLAAAGFLPMGAAWLLLPLLLAALAGWGVARDVASKAERSRRAMRRAANEFVQLVAIGLTTDQSVEDAIRFALDVGTGDAFSVLRDEILAAPMRGVPVWDAIDAVGRRVGVRELTEFATSVERQGLQGVAIGETVASLAVSMRAKALDELERDADRANANLSGPTIGFVVTTIVFLAYPLAQRISDAFG